MKTSRSLAAAFLAVAALACASGGGAREDGRTVRPSANRIFQDEIQQSPHRNLSDFLRTARPHWFRPQVVGGEVIQVFMDGRRIGGTEVLNGLSVSQASEIRYFTQSEAASRFLTSSSSPVIEIITRTR